jgi:hypothetical protein
MTPDKIEEAFDNFFPKYNFDNGNYSERHEDYLSRKSNLFRGWQACAEWMLSQASEDFGDFRKSIGEEIFQCNQTASRLILEYDLMKREEAAFQAARLSSAKEITSLKDQILRYEHDNRELRAKSLNEIAEKDARIEQLESMIENGLGWEDMKNETTYPNG